MADGLDIGPKTQRKFFRSDQSLKHSKKLYSGKWAEWVGISEWDFHLDKRNQGKVAEGSSGHPTLKSGAYSIELGGRRLPALLGGKIKFRFLGDEVVFLVGFPTRGGWREAIN